MGFCAVSRGIIPSAYHPCVCPCSFLCSLHGYRQLSFLLGLWLLSVAKSCLTSCDCRTAVHQVSLTFTISWSLLQLVSIESVMPSNHLILCHCLLLLPSILHSIRIFSYELALSIRWPKYWSFSFSISPSSEYSEFH